MGKTEPKTIRFDSEKLAKAERLGIDLTVYFRKQLDEAINDKQCPTCGQKMTLKNKKTIKEKREKDVDLL